MCKCCLIYLWDGESFVPAGAWGLKRAFLTSFKDTLLSPTKVPFINRLFKENVAILSMLHDKNGNIPSLAPMLKGRTLVILRLKAAEGVVDMVVLGLSEPLSEREKLFLKGIANPVVFAIERMRLHNDLMSKTADLNRKLEILSVLYEIDKAILSTLDQGEILDRLMDSIRPLLSCDRVTISLLDEDREGFVVGATASKNRVEKGQFVPLRNSFLQRIIVSKKPYYSPDLTLEKGITSIGKRLLKEDGIHSTLCIPLIAKGEFMGTLNIGSFERAAFTPDQIDLAEKIAGRVAVALENARLYRELLDLHASTVTALTKAIDARSPWTRGHSERIERYALMIGEELGLDKGFLERLKLAVLFHDVGKIGTYDYILDKNGGLLQDEWAVVREHPVKGADILSPIRQFKDIIPIIRHHHEHFDGRGYPDGLSGNMIPLGARIIAAADAFDAIITNRPYRKGRSGEDAIKEIKRCSGTQFDPSIVDALEKALKK